MTERDAPNREEDAHTVKGPSGPPPDKDLVYDPELTDADEANVPPESEADPQSPRGSSGS